MSTWAPSDYIEMVKVIFFGVAALCLPFTTAYVMIAAARSKRAEDASHANAASIAQVSSNVAIIEKNTNSISTRNEAIAKALGIKEGIEQERASVAAAALIKP